MITAHVQELFLLSVLKIIELENKAFEELVVCRLI